jgi:hypothetical protein
MQHIVELIRLRMSYVDGTFGILKIDAECFCVTLELPYISNKSNKSCIPKGEYKCRPYSSNKFPSVYEITNVPGRTKILFHIGNFKKDTNGCILLGQHFSDFGSKHKGIMNSKIMFDKFREVIGDNPFTLTITEIY